MNKMIAAVIMFFAYVLVILCFTFVNYTVINAMTYEPLQHSMHSMCERLWGERAARIIIGKADADGLEFGSNRQCPVSNDIDVKYKALSSSDDGEYGRYGELE